MTAQVCACGQAFHHLPLPGEAAEPRCLFCAWQARRPSLAAEGAEDRTRAATQGRARRSAAEARQVESAR